MSMPGRCMQADGAKPTAQLRVGVMTSLEHRAYCTLVFFSFLISPLIVIIAQARSVRYVVALLRVLPPGRTPWGTVRRTYWPFHPWLLYCEPTS